MFDDPQKAFLHSIFSIMVIAQNRVGDPEDHPSVARYQSFYYGRRSFHGRRVFQNAFSQYRLPRHFAFLKQKDSRRTVSVLIFCGYFEG
jgi:hypothetical protein